jgi:hypothetical protein
MIADKSVPTRRRIVQCERYDAGRRVAQRVRQKGQAGTSGTKLDLHVAIVLRQVTAAFGSTRLILIIRPASRRGIMSSTACWNEDVLFPSASPNPSTAG